MMKKFVDEYETVVITDENGREKPTAVYRGDYFEIAMDADGILHFRKTSILLLIAIIIFQICAGFVANQGMNQMYVALPYVVAYFPLLYLVMSILRLPKEKRKYQSDEIQLSFDRMKRNSRFLLVLLGLGIIGEIIFIVLFSLQGQWGLEFLYLVLEMLALGSVYFSIRSQQQVIIQPWSEQES